MCTSAWRGSGPEEVGSQALAWWPQGAGDLWTLLLTVGLLFDPVHPCGVWAAVEWRSEQQAWGHCSLHSHHWNLFLYSVHCAGKRTLIHGMKRDCIIMEGTVGIYILSGKWGVSCDSGSRRQRMAC